LKARAICAFYSWCLGCASRRNNSFAGGFCYGRIMPCSRVENNEILLQIKIFILCLLSQLASSDSIGEASTTIAGNDEPPL